MKRTGKWAKSILDGEHGEVVVLDCETTGLGDIDEPCQAAVVDLVGTTLFDSPIKPTIPISAGATVVHGITNDDVKDAPTMAQVWSDLYEAIGDKLVLVYNKSFDRSKITQGCRANNVANITLLCRWDCVMEAYSEYYGQWRRGGYGYRWQSLTDACYQQGIPVNNAHNALGDALMTLELLKAMAGVREGVK